MTSFKNHNFQGWGFSSVIESLPSKCKALGFVLNSGRKEKKNRSFLFCVNLACHLS